MIGASPLAGDWLVRLEFHYSEQDRESEGCGWNKFLQLLEQLEVNVGQRDLAG